MTDAAKGHNPALSLRYTIWLHLFMDHNHRMRIGRLSKSCFKYLCDICFIFSAMRINSSFVGHPHYQQAQEGMADFPPSVEKSTMEALWHSDDSFYLQLPPIEPSFHATALFSVITR